MINDRITFDVVKCPDGTFGVTATADEIRALGVDMHWHTREAAEHALVVYRVHPEMHSKSTEAEIIEAYVALDRAVSS